MDPIIEKDTARGDGLCSIWATLIACEFSSFTIPTKLTIHELITNLICEIAKIIETINDNTPEKYGYNENIINSYREYKESAIDDFRIWINNLCNYKKIITAQDINIFIILSAVLNIEIVIINQNKDDPRLLCHRYNLKNSENTIYLFNKNGNHYSPCVLHNDLKIDFNKMYWIKYQYSYDRTDFKLEEVFIDSNPIEFTCDEKS